MSSHIQYKFSVQKPSREFIVRKVPTKKKSTSNQQIQTQSTLFQEFPDGKTLTNFKSFTWFPLQMSKSFALKYQQPAKSSFHDLVRKHPTLYQMANDITTESQIRLLSRVHKNKIKTISEKESKIKQNRKLRYFHLDDSAINNEDVDKLINDDQYKEQLLKQKDVKLDKIFKEKNIEKYQKQSDNFKDV